MFLAFCLIHVIKTYERNPARFLRIEVMEMLDMILGFFMGAFLTNLLMWVFGMAVVIFVVLKVFIFLGYIFISIDCLTEAVMAMINYVSGLF